MFNLIASSEAVPNTNNEMMRAKADTMHFAIRNAIPMETEKRRTCGWAESPMASKSLVLSHRLSHAAC